MFKRLIALLVCLTFSFSNLQYVHAQASPAEGGDFSVNQLPVPGTMLGESAPFAPLALKGLVVNLNKPLEFQFIVDTGKGPQDNASIKEEANKLVKYFLAGLTIPEGELWVNLSPYEKNRITTPSLGQTELGRDLLAQDYILKQLTASLIYPEKDLGKEFWNRVYSKAQQQFGTTNIPVNTFNKVWILPDQAQVFENGAAAYVTKSTLKVMLDEDYLAMQKHSDVRVAEGGKTRASSFSAPASAGFGEHAGETRGQDLNINRLGSQIVRQIVIPEITKEVNTGKNFAPLRQIYDAMILAKWYKETFVNGLLDAVYTNKKKTAGVNLTDPAVKEQIYQRYLQAYKKGVFNYIKEDPTPDGQTVPRKYFSGGMIWKMTLGRTKNPLAISRPDGAMIGIVVALTGVIGAGLAVAMKLRKDIEKAQKEQVRIIQRKMEEEEVLKKQMAEYPEIVQRLEKEIPEGKTYNKSTKVRRFFPIALNLINNHSDFEIIYQPKKIEMVPKYQTPSGTGLYEDAAWYLGDEPQEIPESISIVKKNKDAAMAERRSSKGLILYSGPSATGKSPLWEQIKARYPDRFSRIVLYTSRKMRSGEVEGVDYYFRSKEEIEALARPKDSNFATMDVNGELQGINLADVQQAVESGKQAIAEVSVDWARFLKERYPDKVFMIFITPLSQEEIERRVKETGKTNDEVIYDEMIKRQRERHLEKLTPEDKQEKRAVAAAKEMKRIPEYDALIVNDQLRDIAAHQIRWNGEEGKKIVEQFMKMANKAVMSTPTAQNKPDAAMQVSNSKGEKFKEFMARKKSEGRIPNDLTDPRTWAIDPEEKDTANKLSSMTNEDLGGFLRNLISTGIIESMGFLANQFPNDNLGLLEAFIDRFEEPIEIIHHFRTPIARIKQNKDYLKFAKQRGTLDEGRTHRINEILNMGYEYKAFIRELIIRWDTDSTMSTPTAQKQTKDAAMVQDFRNLWSLKLLEFKNPNISENKIIESFIQFLSEFYKGRWDHPPTRRELEIVIRHIHKPGLGREWKDYHTLYLEVDQPNLVHIALAALKNGKFQFPENSSYNSYWRVWSILGNIEQMVLSMRSQSRAMTAKKLSSKTVMTAEEESISNRLQAIKSEIEAGRNFNLVRLDHLYLDLEDQKFKMNYQNYINFHDQMVAIYRSKEGAHWLYRLERAKQLRDGAMATTHTSYGGIDLNQIAIKRTGKTIKMQFDPAQLNSLEQGVFEGFTPVIINMTRISSPFQLLGVNQPAKEPELLAKV